MKENERNEMSRRGFLRLVMGLGLGIGGGGQERYFSPLTGKAKELLVKAGYQDEEAWRNIVQVEVSLLEIEERWYRVEINEQVMAEFIFYEAGHAFGGPDLEAQAERWLEANKLEIEIFASDRDSKMGGYFKPPVLRAARIGIGEEMVKGIWSAFGRSEAAEVSRGVNPLIVIPHEVGHLLDWIRNPYLFLISFGVEVGEDTISVVGVREGYRRMRREERTQVEALLFGGTVGIFLFQTFKLINAVFGLDRLDENRLPGNDFFEQKLREDSKFRELARNIFEFVPID